MAKNLHNPARYEGESFADYKARRAASNKANRDAQRDPNHGLVGARKQFRDSMLKSGAMGKRTRASDALMAAWAQKRATKAELRDEHGAYTCIGPMFYAPGLTAFHSDEPSSRHHDCNNGYARRKWLAGISAQRGY